MVDIDVPIAKKMLDNEPKIISRTETNYLPVEGLPSDYKLYPEGTKILARPLNVAEVKLLASMNEDNYNFIINDILKRTVKGIDVSEILVADKYFIIFWLRANTYKNPGYELDFECSKCEKISRYSFGTDVLDVNYIKEDFDLGSEETFPLSKDNFTIVAKRIKDENKLAEFMKRNGTSLMKYDEEILDIASNVNSLNGEELSLAKKYEYVEKMHPEDFSYLISYIDSRSFGVKDKVNAVCNDCKGVTPIGVSFRPEFFIPKHNFG